MITWSTLDERGNWTSISPMRIFSWGQVGGWGYCSSGRFNDKVSWLLAGKRSESIFFVCGTKPWAGVLWMYAGMDVSVSITVCFFLKLLSLARDFQILLYTCFKVTAQTKMFTKKTGTYKEESLPAPSLCPVSNQAQQTEEGIKWSLEPGISRFGCQQKNRWILLDFSSRLSLLLLPPPGRRQTLASYLKLR